LLKNVLIFIEKQINCELLKYKLKNLSYFKTTNLNLDIIKLSGTLKKYYRIRIGKIRFLFYEENGFLIISRVDFRGKIYN
jgi:mRNA-degrading endonuclease RelE of RelBE toxin-antitoxin system